MGENDCWNTEFLGDCCTLTREPSPEPDQNSKMLRRMGHRKRRRKRRIILRDEKWTNTAKTLGKHRFTEAWTWNVRKARSSFPRRERFCEMLRVVAKTKAEIVLLSEMQEDTPSIKWIKSREINGVLVQAAVSSYGIRGQ